MFEAVNQLLYKQGNGELSSDIIEQFNPYITIKSFSFYENGKFCNYINNTLNTYSNVFENVEDQYIFFDTMIPKLRFKRLNYIKKPKSEKEEERPVPEFLSKREVEMYENMLKSNT